MHALAQRVKERRVEDGCQMLKRMIWMVLSQPAEWSGLRIEQNKGETMPKATTRVVSAREVEEINRKNARGRTVSRRWRRLCCNLHELNHERELLQ